VVGTCFLERQNPGLRPSAMIKYSTYTVCGDYSIVFPRVSRSHSHINELYTANGLRGLDIIRGQTSKDDRALNVKYFGLDVHGHPAIHGPPPIALSGYHGTSETKDILWMSRLIGRVPSGW